jgi:hypothetical protein
VLVLFGETKLQTTVSLPAAVTVIEAKKGASDELLQHFRLQSGILPSIPIDDECTEFYPSTIQLQNVIYAIT